MSLILHFLGMAVAVYLTVNIVPGIAVSGGWGTIAIVTIVWSVITAVIKPIAQLLALPITIATLGIFYFIVNALLFWGMEMLVPGFSVSGFLPALIGSVVLSVISWIILSVLKE